MLLRFRSLIRASYMDNSYKLCLARHYFMRSCQAPFVASHLLGPQLVTCTSGGSDHRHVAHVRPKCLWDDHTTISLLKILQNCHNHARHSTRCRIQCVHKLSRHFLCFLFAAIYGHSVRCISGFRPALQPQLVMKPLDTCTYRDSIY